MPFDPSGLFSLGGTIIKAHGDKKNRQFQRQQNADDRQFTRDMYEWSRWDAKSDWEREAVYNSPQEQMTRLRQAGLNPNLIYGKGADNTMSSIRPGQMTGGNQPAPKIDTDIVSGGLEQYYRLQNIQANTDNLAQSVALSKEEQILKQATVAKPMQEIATSKFELQKSTELKDEVIRQAQLNNTKTETEIGAVKVQTQLAINKDEREKLANAVNVEKTVQDIYESKLRQANLQLQNTKLPEEREKLLAEISQLKTATSNAKIDGAIKTLDLKLREKGINPNDPMYARLIGQAISNNQLMDNVDNAFEEWFKSIKQGPSYREGNYPPQ